MGYIPRRQPAAIVIPPMLSRRARWACWIGSLFVLYVAGTVNATWLTLVWMGWLLIMLQQWRAHRADYRARVAQRGQDIRFWRAVLADPSNGLQQHEAARDMLAYLGLDATAQARAELEQLYRMDPTPDVIGARRECMTILDPRRNRAYRAPGDL